uniref:Leucine-rich repeat-containing N-terminal plant-type domain-containing protein n=1 Tax=Kalanchoe fedtschenkoi TaxID=63787 RepID=A0A7N0TBA1_KALFE
MTMMTSPPTLFAILSLALIALLAPPTSGDESSRTDVVALIALKQSLSDPDHYLATWDPNSAHACGWDYITCDIFGRVTTVDLGVKNLSGELVPQLGNLTALQYLDLYSNSIRGGFPPELGRLSNLIAMDLSNNNLSGPIPESFGNLVELEYLRVNDNPGLEGVIPLAVVTLPNLLVLDINNTHLRLP